MRVRRGKGFFNQESEQTSLVIFELSLEGRTEAPVQSSLRQKIVWFVQGNRRRPVRLEESVQEGERSQIDRYQLLLGQSSGMGIQGNIVCGQRLRT